MKIYLASSFRNLRYPSVLAALRAEGHCVYDFRDNESRGGRGIPESARNPATVAEFQATLDSEPAVLTFNSHVEAIEDADACVLVLPCGRSAHLEFGYAAGIAVRKLVVLFDPATDPIGCDLMYGMATHLCSSVPEVLAALIPWERDGETYTALLEGIGCSVSPRRVYTADDSPREDWHWCARLPNVVATNETPFATPTEAQDDVENFVRRWRVGEPPRIPE